MEMIFRNIGWKKIYFKFDKYVVYEQKKMQINEIKRFLRKNDKSFTTIINCKIATN